MSRIYRKKKRSILCLYCAYSTTFNDEQTLCTKVGVVKTTSECRKFVCDPLKHVPPSPKALDLCKYDEEDCSLYEIPGHFRRL